LTIGSAFSERDAYNLDARSYAKIVFGGFPCLENNYLF